MKLTFSRRRARSHRSRYLVEAEARAFWWMRTVPRRRESREKNRRWLQFRSGVDRLRHPHPTPTSTHPFCCPALATLGFKAPFTPPAPPAICLRLMLRTRTYPGKRKAEYENYRDSAARKRRHTRRWPAVYRGAGARLPEAP